MMITMITNLPPPSSPPFVAELREARAENERLQDRVSVLNALLDEAVVAAAYKHHDCKHLFAALHNSPPNAQVRGAVLGFSSASHAKHHATCHVHSATT